MARARTLAAMRIQARSYADAVDSLNTSESEANTWINQSLALLWGKLTNLDATRFMVTTVLTPNGALEYDFADAAVFSPTAEDIMSIVGIDRMISDARVPLDPFAWNDRGVSNLRSSGYLCQGDVRYAVHRQGIDGTDSRLVFDRVPPAGTYQVHYIQAPPTLVGDLSTFDGVAGFEEWIVLRVAILMKDREESDPSVLMAMQREVENEIRTLGANRDAGRSHVPARVWGRQNRGLRGWLRG